MKPLAADVGGGRLEGLKDLRILFIEDDSVARLFVVRTLTPYVKEIHAVDDGRQGLFAFANLEEAVAAVEQINSDYAVHCRSARWVAEEYFAAERVLAKLLAAVGL